MKKIDKKAVVYSKWLASLGGGEIVSCNIATTLRDLGYKVILISGKKITRHVIKDKLGIELRGIKTIENWNNEQRLKNLVEGSDLFFNTSFMDYSFGYAKRNIYYTHFPTSAYDSLKGMLVNNIVLPLAARFFKPIELMEYIQADSIYNGRPAYRLEPLSRIAISFLESSKNYNIVFKVFFENFYKSLLESFKVSFEGAKVLSNSTYVNHHRNEIQFSYKIQAETPTIYLNLSYKRLNLHFLPQDRLFLIFPKVSVSEITEKLGMERIYRIFNQRIVNRLRAGLFVNIIQRLKTYSVILSNSEFTSSWINSYWGLKSRICFPPVNLIFEKRKINFRKKKNWICSVGRFFQLGHGKKQEVLVAVFKKFFDLGNKSWELHLAGGVTNEPVNVDYINKLRELAKGYPIYFHLNIPRKELESIYRTSKIYWHATGFGENPDKKPVLFEHFGIAPVEAISAGCIPILYNGGGLPEIIDKLLLDKKMHLFSDFNQLMQSTIYFSSKRRKINWKKIFELLESNFSVRVFRENISKII